MALEDIIPLEALMSHAHGINAGKDASRHSSKKRKLDKEAMNSSFMLVPRMNVRVARDFLDIGLRELYELKGRAPESLFEEIRAVKPDAPEWILPYIRLCIYFEECEKPEPAKLNPQAWSE